MSEEPTMSDPERSDETGARARLGDAPRAELTECDSSKDGKHWWVSSNRFPGAETCIECGARGIDRNYRAATPLQQAIERFIEAAEHYRINSELWADAPIEITQRMIQAREVLRAAARVGGAPEETFNESRSPDGDGHGSELSGKDAPAAGHDNRAAGSEPADSQPVWQPIETAPKDGSWFWTKRDPDPSHPNSILESAFKWDASHGMWFAGTGWWHQFPMGFTQGLIRFWT